MNVLQGRTTRTTSGLTAGVSLLVAFASGCTTDGGQRDATTVVTDSAGVAIVTNSGPDRALTVRETLHVGVVEGDPQLQFYRIRSIALDPAGGFWVSDQDPTIRHYDRLGAYTGSVGGSGSGPGESPRGYLGVTSGPDELTAIAFNGTLQFFSADGEFVGSRSAILRTGSLLPVAGTNSGWIYQTTLLPPAQGATTGLMQWTLVSGSRGEESLDTLVSLVGEGLRAVELGPERTGWGNASYFDGKPSVAADWSGRIYYSDRMEYRVEVYAREGGLSRVVRRDTEATPYPADLEPEIEAAARRYEAPMGTPSAGDALRRMVARALPLSPPEHLPFIQSVLVSSDGDLWVLRADRHPRPASRAIAAAVGTIRPYWEDEWRAPLHFDLFTPDGSYRGSTELPAEFVPMAVTRDEIFGSVYDDFDVEYVVAYRVEGLEE